MSTRFDDSLHLLIISKIISGNIKVEEASMFYYNFAIKHFYTKWQNLNLKHTWNTFDSSHATIEDFTV